MTGKKYKPLIRKRDDTQLVLVKLLSRVNSKLNIGKRKLGKIYFEGS